MRSKIEEQIISKPVFCDRFTATVTAGVTMGTTVVDRLGFDKMLAVLVVGGASATTTTEITAVIYESDDSTTTGTWTTYDTATYSLGAYATAVASGDEVFVDLRPAKRYVNVGVNPGALGAASADVTIVFILGDAQTEPVS